METIFLKIFLNEGNKQMKAALAGKRSFKALRQNYRLTK